MSRDGTVAADSLARRTDLELLSLVQQLPQGSRVARLACELLIERYRYLIRLCIRRYENSPESWEELMQVGYVGLLSAIRRFDPQVGRNLAAYAGPCIRGEVKRHFRDNRWPVHVPRCAQELRLDMRQATAELTQRLGRVPEDRELACHLHISDAQLRMAQDAELAFEPSSLDAPRPGWLDSGGGLIDHLGGDDPRLERALDLVAVRTHFSELPIREQRLLLLRFYRNMSQREIGEEVGLSQMHVSRLLGQAVGYLRERVLGPEPGTGRASAQV